MFSELYNMHLIYNEVQHNEHAAVKINNMQPLPLED